MTKVYNKSSYKGLRQMLRNTMPKAEFVLWGCLKNKQLYGFKFRRQYGVDNYIVDFYCPKLKLAIELDGESHFLPGAKRKDQIRQAHIESYGIKFLRFTNIDVLRNLSGVVDTIIDELPIDRDQEI